MSKLFIICMLATSVLLTSCASNNAASPQNINGKYYMAGDAACVRYRIIDSDTIECATNEGVSTGYRNAMTDQEIQMWQFQVRQQQLQMQELTRQLQQMNEQNRTRYTNCYQTFGGMNCYHY